MNKASQNMFIHLSFEWSKLLSFCQMLKLFETMLKKWIFCVWYVILVNHMNLDIEILHSDHAPHKWYQIILLWKFALTLNLTKIQKRICKCYASVQNNLDFFPLVFPLIKNKPKNIHKTSLCCFEINMNIEKHVLKLTAALSSRC